MAEKGKKKVERNCSFVHLEPPDVFAIPFTRVVALYF
jgi:hypothetical protein